MSVESRHRHECEMSSASDLEIELLPNYALRFCEPGTDDDFEDNNIAIARDVVDDLPASRSSASAFAQLDPEDTSMESRRQGHV